MTRTTDSDIDDVAAKIEAITSSISHGCGWLLDRIGEDGDPGASHGHYYRVPWTLALAGHRREASAVLSWIERNALDPNGDLRSGGPREGFERMWSSYPLANIASGAWHLERYDTAHRIARRLEAYQHPEWGGAFAAHPDHRTDARQDLFPTAQLGMTGLTTGHLDLAHGAYRWFEMLYEAQPELPTRLYSATDGSTLIAGDTADERFNWQVVTDFSQPRQAFYNPGIAAAFLGRYHMATGEVKALDLARDYLALTVSGSDLQFDHSESVQVCKFAWGSAVLLEATGGPEYLEFVLRMGDWFIECQNDDGSWDNSPFLMQRTDDPDSVRVEITAEFVQHQISIINAIGGRRRLHA